MRKRPSAGVPFPLTRPLSTSTFERIASRVRLLSLPIQRAFRPVECHD